jgi:hypothetical protein
MIIFFCFPVKITDYFVNHNHDEGYFISSMVIRTDFSLRRSLCTSLDLLVVGKKNNVIERERRNLYIDCKKTREKNSSSSNKIFLH